MLSIFRLSKGHICSIAETIEGIMLKLSGNVKENIELNQMTLCASTLSKGLTCGFAETAKGIMLKLSGNVKGKFELNQMILVQPGYQNLALVSQERLSLISSNLQGMMREILK